MMANNEDIIDVYNRFKEKGFPYYNTDKKWILKLWDTRDTRYIPGIPGT